MKDEQKSRALQACRLLLDVYDDSATERPGQGVELTELDHAVNIARLAVHKKGQGIKSGR